LYAISYNLWSGRWLTACIPCKIYTSGISLLSDGTAFPPCLDAIKMEIFFHVEKYFHAISYKSLVSPYFMALTSICSSTILLNSWRRESPIFSAALVMFPLVICSILRMNSRSKLALASL